MRRTLEQKIDLINEIFEKEELKNSISGNSVGKAKILHIRDTAWTNLLTKRSETVSNIYTLATEDSGYAMLINKILVNGVYNGEKINFNIQLVKQYWHVNISSGLSDLTYENGTLSITIVYQNFCNPLTPAHLLEDYGADVLLATNLETQNLDDSFTDVDSVCNSEYDRSLPNNALAGSSYIELLTGLSRQRLVIASEKGEFNYLVKKIIKTTPDEIWVKLKADNHYSKWFKSDLKNIGYKISKYFPMITYEEIQDLGIEYIDVKKDLACFGLGSAGTAILDLIGRCNYFKSAVLLDFDTVEEKNLRNQWYTKNDKYRYKVARSKFKLCDMSTVLNDVSTFDIRVEDFIARDLKYCFKYIISGFDNLEARKLVYDSIVNGKLRTEYLIDCRYLDLACSIYFIKTSDKEQMDYYVNQLNADMKLVKDTEPEVTPFTEFELFDYWISNIYFISNCARKRSELGFTSGCEIHECNSAECRKYLYKSYIESFGNTHKLGYEGNSCIRQNFIDIYKYVGAIVMGAIRQIENGEEKPYTHIEAETHVNGLPACMVVRG